MLRGITWEPAWEPCGRSALADVQAGDGAADDHSLDLGGAFEDREDLRISVPAFHREVAGVAVAAEDLHGLIGYPDRRFPGDELGHRPLGVGEGHPVPCHPRG